MRKIQLTDGLPGSVRKEESSKEVTHLMGKIIEIAKKSELSYVEMNIALYLADKELYHKTISTRINER